jgi:tetratricopeptide (TPR) repeat protein
MEKQNKFMHLGIVENGKIYSLKGDHTEALRHYREGIRMATKENAQEVFFQHYTQCVMESLELSGAYDEVISYCEKAIALLVDKIDVADIIKKNYVVAVEKQAVQYLLKDDKAEATTLFKKVQETVGRGKQPLTDELLNWLQRGYTITKQQIESSQKKHKYFTVTKENIKPEMAIELPKTVLPI